MTNFHPKLFAGASAERPTFDRIADLAITGPIKDRAYDFKAGVVSTDPGVRIPAELFRAVASRMMFLYEDLHKGEIAPVLKFDDPLPRDSNAEMDCTKIGATLPLPVDAGMFDDYFNASGCSGSSLSLTPPAKGKGSASVRWERHFGHIIEVYASGPHTHEFYDRMFPEQSVEQGFDVVLGSAASDARYNPPR